MSASLKFKISKRDIFLFSLISLLGIIVSSVFLRFADGKTAVGIVGECEQYFAVRSLPQALGLVFREVIWLCVIIAFSKFQYARLFGMLIIFYKGFSIGVVYSVFFSQFGVLGFKYIILLLLLPNLLYLISMFCAVQLSCELMQNNRSFGQHTRLVETDTRAYILCFFISLLAVCFELFAAPKIYLLLF